IVCQLPNRPGSPRHLQPCSATYRMALSTSKLLRRTFPRCKGRESLIFSYCSCVSSIYLHSTREIDVISVNTPSQISDRNSPSDNLVTKLRPFDDTIHRCRKIRLRISSCNRLDNASIYFRHTPRRLRI